MRRILLFAVGVVALALMVAPAAMAAPLTITPPVNISISTPFAPGCGGTTEGSFPGANFNFANSEVEPWLGVSPTNPNDVAGFWQQDRWSDGGAHGLLAAVSHDGGASWTYSAPHFSVCAGGTPANGGNYGRSSDPWVSWAPNGDLWSISLSVDRTTTRNAVLVSKMAHGTSSWTEPTTVRFDSSEKTGIPLGNNFNDKESLTADPTDESGNLVYAVWDRIVAPSSNAAAAAFEHNKFAFRGPTWFARTTEGAAADPDWEAARPIYDPGEQNQTISNQIVVHPDGTLVDGFLLIKTHQNNRRSRGFSAAVIRSFDKGESWSRRAIIVAPVSAIGETDPEPIHCRPYITGDPLCTLVRSDGVIVDLAVDNSSGPHHGRIYMTWQAHDDNPFGDDLIQVAWSDDRGMNWSNPVTANVNTASQAQFTDQAFEPAVHVNDQGVVAVSFYDFRNDTHNTETDNRLTTDHWIVHSHDGGATWTEDHLAGPFDMHQVPYARGYFVGDYQGLDSQGAVFRPLFTLGSAGDTFDTTFPNQNSTDEFINSAN